MSRFVVLGIYVVLLQAALEALNGLDLFGSRGSTQSVIHVLPDEIQRCKVRKVVFL